MGAWALGLGPWSLVSGALSLGLAPKTLLTIGALFGRWDVHGHTVETCMATQERPAWPHRLGQAQGQGAEPGTRAEDQG